MNDLEIKSRIVKLDFVYQCQPAGLLCNSVLHSLLVDGTQINVGVTAGRLVGASSSSGLDGGNDGVTGGAGVDGSKVWMRSIAWIP